MGNVYMEAEQIRFKDSTYRDVQSGLKAALQGGGGGTTVVANPEGSATADLEKLQVGESIYGIPNTAAKVTYDNTSSGLTADDVQDALDEIVSNFQDGVDDVYDACVAKGSTPASHSLSDVIAAIGAIQTGGNMINLYTGIGDTSDLNASDSFTISNNGLLIVTGWNYADNASVKINNGSNLISQIDGYYYGDKIGVHPVSANQVVTYSSVGTGACSEYISIWFIAASIAP